MDYVRRFIQETEKARGRGLSVGLYGLGKTNIALARRLAPIVDKLTLRSDRPVNTPSNDIPFTKVLIGSASLSDIDEDILFLSPSVRRDKREFKSAKGTLISSDCEMFFEFGTGDKTVLSVTGSDGKSTVTYLASLMLKESGLSSEAACNFGLPLCECEADYPVVELSSFNLQYLNGRSDRCAITTVTPNHLDWHASFEEYIDTKLKLISLSDECVLNADCKICKEVLEKGGAFAAVSLKERFKELKKKYSFELCFTLEDGYIRKNGENFIEAKRLGRQEPHNLLNFMSAASLVSGHASPKAIQRAGCKFRGLPHRCETVLKENGIEYINSSIDTTPMRTAKTLTSLDRQVIIILGGRGKGLPLEPLFEPLKKYAKLAVLYGEAGEETKVELERRGICHFAYFPLFSDAVEYAKSEAKTSDTVLLSPAATAYGQFKNFEDRAEAFKSALKQENKGMKK